MKIQNNSKEIEIISQNFPNNALYQSEEEAKIRNRYNQVPHLNQDFEWESDKTQENINYRRGKRSSLSHQGTTKLLDTGSTICQRQTQIHKRSIALEQSAHWLSVRVLDSTEGLRVKA